MVVSKAGTGPPPRLSRLHRDGVRSGYRRPVSCGGRDGVGLTPGQILESEAGLGLAVAFLWRQRRAGLNSSRFMGGCVFCPNTIQSLAPRLVSASRLRRGTYEVLLSPVVASVVALIALGSTALAECQMGSARAKAKSISSPGRAISSAAKPTRLTTGSRASRRRRAARSTSRPRRPPTRW